MTILLTLSGIWAAGRVAEALGDEDPSCVVIDEVIGTLIAMGLSRRAGIGGELVALALFRVLDIVKPGLIDRAQRLRPEGVGIIADDILAGLGAGLLVRAASRLIRRR